VPALFSFDPTVGVRRHLAGTDHPTGLRSPQRRGHRSLGASAAVMDPGHRLPLVALVPHRRQNYPNTPPPTRATAISEVRQDLPPAPQQTVGVLAALTSDRSATRSPARLEVQAAARSSARSTEATCPAFSAI
jgi:hypothetical protein